MGMENTMKKHKPEVYIGIKPTPMSAVMTTGFNKESKRLVAIYQAAPEMLAALKEIIENGTWQDDGSFVYCPSEDDDGGEYHGRGGIGLAETAIAKAEGGAA
jgi:hypothetical protein